MKSTSGPGRADVFAEAVPPARAAWANPLKWVCSPTEAIYSPAIRRYGRSRGAKGSLVVGLDFEEVEGLFLAEWGGGQIGGQPIGNGQGGGGSFCAKDFPMVGDADRNFWLRAGSIDFRERFGGIYLDAFNEDGGGGFGFFDLILLCGDEIVVIADEHF